MLIGLTVVIVGIAGVLFYSYGRESVPQQPDCTTLVGDWERPDGDYVIRIGSINPDGTSQIAYFNPNPIHVAGATISSQDNVIKLFMELRDVGYPGSKYNLVYNPGDDILQGTYFQAQAQELYNVVFQRKLTN